ncbi:uncharacterized protein [Nicotiana tomentosiformis]|uniref:uncharacterized protein isoform X2 n=1 Tax=Nicotiana tomentosiformis TaxID=4098 RepID=UPI00051BDC54|nr:symplekin isoform X1 [Nicotiana tomentosiformis]XP_009598061.1 symplekin isoform X1 [Nicotiana tomentosiformis]XP_018625535.1 symplekin isoform X1 [Nicotiana tomentosiformis]XP_018625536.1 symplekin isoform X1 [Nicotiana tomentosiformis]
MVGMMSPISRERIASLLSAAKFASDVPSKLHSLRRLNNELAGADSQLLSEFLPSLLDLVSDRFSPVRKLTAEMVGYIGFKHGEFIPDIVPVLISALKDDMPAVARQAITCGIDIFRCTLVKVAIQGLFSSELDDSLESAWAWVLKFREEIYAMAFQPASDGRRLLALKFVESVVLLYTPNPSVSSEPPPALDIEGKFEQFNVSWLRGGHPILNVGDLSVEASQSLGLLLDQLRFPAVKSITNLMIIVLINCLSAIATKRPAFYGRILPVLLSLNPSSSDGNAKHVSGVYHALKNAFVSCLNCTHPGAAPWRDRLEGALREKRAGVQAEPVVSHDSQNNGHIELKDVSSIPEESKPSVKASDSGQSIAGTKRSGVEDNAELVDDNLSKKRMRSAPIVLKEPKQELSANQERVSTGGSTTTRPDGDNVHLQPLVAMFGTLVAQGEKAAASLDILISSISADLLADVVMANMRNLPSNQPKVDDDEEPPLKPEIESDFKQLSSLLSDVVSQSSMLAEKDEKDAQNLVFIEPELQQIKEGDEHLDSVTTNVTSDALNYASEQAPEYVTEPLSSKSTPLLMENDVSPMQSDVADIENNEDFIPGLDSVVRKDVSSELVVVSSVDPTELEDGSQEQGSSLVRSSLEVVPSISTDRSEELSPKAAVTDVTSVNSSTAASVGLSPQLLLPKISAPVIHLPDEQKDNIQKSAFTRVIDAYKQVTVAGGSQTRFSLLAYLGVEFSSELNPWKFLQTHILSDYMNHEGHELTLRVLYRLYGRAEEDQDFISSTAAASVYETFLLTVAETLRDSFPASDKSLSRLLGEAPHLPNSVLKLLERLCCPGSSEKDEKELHSGDRVTQGLSTVWNLILMRPPMREACLRIALQSAVHHLEEVRMKAIRLVANKLYPLTSISQQIEHFANEMLMSVSTVDHKADSNGDGSNPALQKDSASEKPTEEGPSFSITTKDVSSDTLQSSTAGSISPFSIAEGQRCMSLYFALCTKKHSLFGQIFVVYSRASEAVQQAIHQQIHMLVRTIGSSSELLEIISDPPSGSEKLLMQVLQTLTEGTVPSLQLITTIRKLYETKVKDVELLIMILPFLSKDEVLLLFPHVVNVPLDKFQGALSRILQGSAHSGPVLTPAEALIAIHRIDPEREGIPLKKVTDACNACFEQRQTFTHQVLAKVLNQLVEQIPLPLLFMRTVIQAIGAFPSLVDFIMEILSRLVSKQIWKYPKLWVGFVKCALLTKPQSFGVLLQLPPAQLENALSRTPGLRAPLVAHANQPHIKSSLPRSVLTVLGIESDAQGSSQAPPNQSQTGDMGNSDKEALTEKSRESSIAS